MKKKAADTAEQPGQITVRCTGAELVLIEDLKPFQGKFKEMATVDKKKLRRQLIREGITAAATVWRHKVGGKVVLSLLDGHQRHEVLMDLQRDGWKVPAIPINFTECANEAQARRTVMALASTYGRVNQDELVTFAGLAELNLPDLDLEFTFPDIDLRAVTRSVGAGLLAAGADEKVAAKPKKPITKMGDIWTLGKHRLICGDSTEPKTYERLMGKEKATVVFTDPPYGVSIGKKNEMLNEMLTEIGKGGRNQQSIGSDGLPPPELKAILLKAFKEARKVLTDDCAVFVCSPQGGGLGMMMMMMMEAGLEVRHILNWIKNSPTFSMGRLDYDYQHEPILFTWTKTHKRKKEGQFQTSVWAVNKPMASKEHPTMKPVELPTCAILNHSDKGDLVLDNFGGSGTTLLAAEKTGRFARRQ